MRKVKLNRLDLEHVVREVGGGQFSHCDGSRRTETASR